MIPMPTNAVSYSLLILSIMTVSLGCWNTLSVAQVIGDEAELARLHAKAEDAIANDDPDSAAMMSGRAALLAAQLAKQQDSKNSGLYKGWESLFRSQEHTYRAMALFRRAGGELPASSGVCGSLALADASLRRAAESSERSERALIDDAARLKESSDIWHMTVESLITDYQCP
jgi:hypothetical protein